MPKVSMMGTITCQASKGDEMEAVLRHMVEAARQEPGIEIYSYHRIDGDLFSFFAMRSDSEAMQNHGRTAAMQVMMERVIALEAEMEATGRFVFGC